MHKRVIVIVGLAGVVTCGMSAMLLLNHRPTDQTASPVTGKMEEPTAPTTAPSAVVVEEPVEGPPPAVATTTQPAPVAVVVTPPTPAIKKPAPRNPPAAGKSRQPGQGGGGGIKTPPTPEQALARAALGQVGADPDAEAYWADAINDPSRSEHERKDLIEDLNEEGFPDPKHVTPDDLPLIVNRIAIIEQLAPSAMDDVNDAAFAEAYKDLINMYQRVIQQ